MNRRLWQITQEAIEDIAISFADFMLISGPAVVLLYSTRWVFGNMMGNLFTISPPGYVSRLLPAGAGDVKIPLVPGYALDEPFDYVRHMKFIYIGAMTLLLYGFLIMLMYFVLHPSEALKASWDTLIAGGWDALKSGWGAIIDLFAKGMAT
jgi:hypothetical protein